MKAAVMGLLAETALHPGTGGDSGVIDLPVAREVVTGYPVIFGSSMKGCIRSKAENMWCNLDGMDLVNKVFGSPEGAGNIGVSDARILLLPVRSMQGHYRWVTCPYVLERLQRDMAIGGMAISLPDIELQSGIVWSHTEEDIFLEEISFSATGKEKEIAQIAESLSMFFSNEKMKRRLAGQLVVCSDDDFGYLTRCALQINAHNALDDDTKTTSGSVGGLWYEEYIPADTLLYALIFARAGKEEFLTACQEMFANVPYIQLGGSETSGCGWCSVAFAEGEK